MPLTVNLSRAWRFLLLCALLVTAVACGAARNDIPPGTVEPDRFLFDRGNEELTAERWVAAREYFRQIVDGYPQSQVRPEAKLGLGDSYLGEGSSESLVLAANEYREFLAFFPTSTRADYAQYKLAMCFYGQMRAADRDQTQTRQALGEFEAFFERFSTSELLPDVREKWREARDRLSESSYQVGFHYYRLEWYPGAISRFREVLSEDEGFSGRDRVYFYLAESLSASDNNAEAVPYFQRLLDEFPTSELAADTTERLRELQGQTSR